MREDFNVQYELKSAVDLLSDMIINYMAAQERKATYRAEVMVWLEPIELLEVEKLVNHEMTSKLLGTSEYHLVA